MNQLSNLTMVIQLYHKWLDIFLQCILFFTFLINFLKVLYINAFGMSYIKFFIKDAVTLTVLNTSRLRQVMWQLQSRMI